MSEITFGDYSDVRQGDIYPNNPINYLPHELDDLLYYCTCLDASDIKLYTGWPVLVKAHGKTFPATERTLTVADMHAFIERLYRGKNGITILSDGRDLDPSFEIHPDRYTRIRFRASITAMQHRVEQGHRITLRVLASLPPDIKSLNVPQSIIDSFHQPNGMILVTGATGSGKSTLLASIIRSIMETPDAHKDILTFESPIEYLHDEYEKDPSCIISQSEVPRDMQSFGLGVRNALRNNPDIIMSGEMRDTETLIAGIEAASTGHLFLSTLHTNDVQSSISRIMQGIGSNSAVTTQDVIENLRLIVSQRLLQKPGGGRTAIREIGEFRLEDRNMLMKLPPNQLSMGVAEIMDDHGQTFLQDAMQAYDNGLIFEHDLIKIKAQAKYSNHQQNLQPQPLEVDDALV